MRRFFNTAGPTIPADHYHIDPLTRLDWEEVRHLIDEKRYFVLHAPRQTGKTSTLLAMMEALNLEGRYACAYANIEPAQAARGDETKGIPAIATILMDAIAHYLKDRQVRDWYMGEGRTLPPHTQVSALLAFWADTCPRPTILLLDEVDALVGETLISLLRQIRAGYAQRPEAFPQSIILCGVRDVRDYRLHQGDGEVITGGSAFNIKSTSLRMGNFTEQESRSLWLQHTEETGQGFDPVIFPELWEDTRGQPWLVNALARELTWELRHNRDRSRLVPLADYWQARENLILSRATHLDQLADKLKEPRVRAVVSALLSGEEGIEPADMTATDDQQYVEDLGLIVQHPHIRISNRIYREVIPRELTAVAQTRISHQQLAWYVTPDNRLNTPKLLNAFQQFFRENSDIWSQGFDYKEAAPQLLMQAFLQRVINGGGRITREYGLGRKRTDLLIDWPLDKAQGFYGTIQRILIELKLLRGSLETVKARGLEQTAAYAAHVGADEAHLVIFNRDPATPWDQKIWQEQGAWEGTPITVWGA